MEMRDASLRGGEKVVEVLRKMFSQSVNVAEAVKVVSRTYVGDGRDVTHRYA